MPEIFQSCFDFPIHFPESFSCEQFLKAVHSWFAAIDLQGNVKVQLDAF